MKRNTKRVLDFMRTAGPCANATVKPNELDEIMMTTGGQIFSQGLLCNLVSQQLSPNVFRLSLERF